MMTPQEAIQKARAWYAETYPDDAIAMGRIAKKPNGNVHWQVVIDRPRQFTLNVPFDGPVIYEKHVMPGKSSIKGGSWTF